MNAIQRAKSASIRMENLKFGFSTLHVWLNSLKHALNLSYYLELKTHSVRNATKEQRERKQERENEVKEALWNKLNIKVDRVVQGKGTSNTGNVARKFFQNACQSAQATGLDETFLKRMHAILQALSSGHDVNADTYSEYALETAKLYNDLYGWYWMLPTVHKVLMHGGDIIKHFQLPIGMLSEDAQEGRNKDFRRLREHNTRNNLRENTTRDLINGLLVSSDPVITSLRHLKTPKPKKLDADAKLMLFLPKTFEEESDDDEASELEESDLSDAEFERM